MQVAAAAIDVVFWHVDDQKKPHLFGAGDGGRAVHEVAVLATPQAATEEGGLAGGKGRDAGDPAFRRGRRGCMIRG